MATSALVDVRDIVEWLRRTEERIGMLYARAAGACSEDPSFCAFLQELSEDEKSHARFMSMACKQLRGDRHRPPIDILLDGQTRSMVEDLFERFERLLTATEVAKKDVIEYIARAEASELNPIFLYVAEEYRTTGREGERMTGEIQGHLLRIQEFIDALPRNLRPSVDVATLPYVGEDRFLVVEDHAPLRRLVASLLSRRGAVDTVSECRQGLERLQEHFHECIVTDIRLPGMDGLEFYRRAIEYDSHLKKRFLFCSGDIGLAHETYLSENKLPLLKKPFGLEEFQAAVDKILSHGRARHHRRDVDR
jgi:CheY-like chemotaxis protein